MNFENTQSSDDNGAALWRNFASVMDAKLAQTPRPIKVDAKLAQIPSAAKKVAVAIEAPAVAPVIDHVRVERDPNLWNRAR